MERFCPLFRGLSSPLRSWLSSMKENRGFVGFLYGDLKVLGRNASTFGEGDHCGAFCLSCQLLSDTRSVEEAVAWEHQGVSVEYDTPVVPWRWPCLYLISQSEMTENEQILEKTEMWILSKGSWL